MASHVCVRQDFHFPIGVALAKKEKLFGNCPAKLCASLPFCARKLLNLQVPYLACNLHIRRRAQLGCVGGGLHSSSYERGSPVSCLSLKGEPMRQRQCEQSLGANASPRPRTLGEI
jgi:hypothetical protein